MTPEALVDASTRILEPLEADANTAWWDANTDASDATQRRRAEADVAFSDALADRDRFAEIRAARGSHGLDARTARQLELLEQMHTPHQGDADLRRRTIELQTDIESRFARFRGTIDGETVDDNQIREILRKSHDTAERRAAWEASKLVGAEVAADVRELARLRNEGARVLGARDHFALTLATTEFEEGELFATLDAVDRITAEPFAELKQGLDEALAAQFGVDRADLRAWHYDDPFFQEPPELVGIDLDPQLGALDVDDLTVRTFDRMGLDVRGVLGRSDLVPREGKVQHAFCIDVDRRGDVRVLSNNVPGEQWSETMLHEFGHAVYFEGVDRDMPWLLRTMHMCLTEGVAMRCGRLVHDPDWLRTIAGVPATTVDELEPALRAARRAALLVFARWVLVMTHFERGLYADPDGPHDTRWWDLVERYQLVQRPDARVAPDWAAKIHIAAAPVYYHNYLFGELFASQLTTTFGNLMREPAAGRSLAARVFEPGASLRWDALVRQATGEPLSPAAFGRELV